MSVNVYNRQAHKPSVCDHKAVERLWPGKDQAPLKVGVRGPTKKSICLKICVKMIPTEF